MEKEIRLLEWLIELWKYNNAGMEKEIQAIESLIKGYKELEEENNANELIINSLRLEVEICGEIIREYRKASIPISVIQNKIDELKKDIIDGRSVIETITGEKSNFEILTEIKMSGLQELLEERVK